MVNQPTSFTGRTPGSSDNDCLPDSLVPLFVLRGRGESTAGAGMTFVNFDYFRRAENEGNSEEQLEKYIVKTVNSKIENIGGTEDSRDYDG